MKYALQVLGRRRADGSSLIKVEQIKDGIVAFEDEADAHRYASMLEAEGCEVRGPLKRLRTCLSLHLCFSKSVCKIEGKQYTWAHLFQMMNTRSVA